MSVGTFLCHKARLASILHLLEEPQSTLLSTYFLPPSRPPRPEPAPFSISVLSTRLTRLIFPSSKHRLHHLPPAYLLRPSWESQLEVPLCHALQVATLQGSTK